MIKKKINFVLTAICGAVFTCCFLSVFISFAERDMFFAPILGAAVFALMVFVYSIMKKHEEFLTNKRINIIFFTAAALLLILQLVLIFNMEYRFKLSDPRVIHAYTKRYVIDGTFDNVKARHRIYMARYPNVWGIVYFLIPYYKLVYLITGEVTKTAAEVLNVILIQISVILTFFTSKRIFRDNSSRLFCGLLTAAMPVMLIYSPFFHSDTVGMFFLIIAVNFYIRMMTAKNAKTAVIYGAVSALAAAVGNTIKGTLVIIIIAAVLTVLLKHPMKTAAVIAALYIGLFAVSSTASRQIGLKIGLVTEQELAENEYPITHWIMMALNEKGGHSVEDSKYTASFGSYEEKKEADTAVIKERLKDLDSPLKVIKRIHRRMSQTWGDGTYNYRRPLSKSKFSPWLKKIALSPAVAFCSVTYHAAMFIAMAAGVARTVKKRRCGAESFAVIALGGLIAFLIIWENLVRYIVTFIPLYMFLSTIGVRYVYYAARRFKLKRASKLDA